MQTKGHNFAAFILCTFTLTSVSMVCTMNRPQVRWCRYTRVAAFPLRKRANERCEKYRRNSFNV